MVAALKIPSIKNAKEFHLARWVEISADPEMHRLPGRIETNRFGHIIVMPPPGFSHSNRQSSIFGRLMELMPQGRTLAECALLTTDGVKGVDFVWVSEARIKRGLKGEVLTIAPEICVEVISPTNTKQEMDNKRALYFEAGADEVWFCDQHGVLHFFLKRNADTEAQTSKLCPAMPQKIAAS